MKEYINPLDIPYQYQHYTRKGQYAHREAADPTLVLFKGRYYCFASMSGGFYYSDDLVSWRWHKNPQLDMYRYAPDAREIDGWLYFCASSKGTPSVIRRTQDPLSDCFETVSMPLTSGIPICLWMMTGGCTCTGAATIRSRSTAWSSTGRP